MTPSDPRRVMIIDPSPAPTGALRAAVNIARGIQPQKARLVLATSASVDQADLSIFEEIVRLPMRQIRRSAIDLTLYGPNLLAAGLRLRRSLRDDDVLVVNDFYLLHGWLVRRLGFRGRIVTWVRIDPLAFPAPIRRIWLEAMRTASDAVVAVSGFIVERLRTEGIQAELLYDPVDPASAPVNATRHGTQRIVQIANYTRGKGQDDAIAAFAQVAPRYPAASLVMYGGEMGLQRNRDYRAELERQARSTGLGDRIRLRDFARDPGSVLADAEIGLVLSHRESFSLACLEASGRGLPVIATRSGGPEEIVQDGETGLLCGVGDIGEIASAMERLLGDPRKGAAMGASGAALVRRRFAREAFDNRLRDLLFPGG